jgi:hypothetical protein
LIGGLLLTAAAAIAEPDGDFGQFCAPFTGKSLTEPFPSRELVRP